MAKKKQKSAPSPRKSSEKSFSSSLGEQLSKKELLQKLDLKDAPRAPSPTPHLPDPTPEPPLDDEALFLAALESVPAPTELQKRRGASPFHGELARKLGPTRPQAPATHAPTGEVTSTPQEHDAPAAPPTHEPAAPRTDADLFSLAVDAMQPNDLYAGKYHGAVKNLPKEVRQSAGGSDVKPQKISKKQRESQEEEARQQIEELREELLFTRAVGPLDSRIDDQDKYFRQQPRPVREERSGYASEPPEGMITPPLPKSGEGLHRLPPLDSSQRGLLNRARLWARKNELLVLNLRGDSVEDALRQLELFIHQCWKDGALYTRVVHGRGLQSEEGIPVLKPSVLHWLEGPGFRYVRGYAPELTQDNDYGSLIVCLTHRDASAADKKER